MYIKYIIPKTSATTTKQRKKRRTYVDVYIYYVINCVNFHIQINYEL